MKILFLDIDGVLHPNCTVAVEPSGSISAIGAFRWLRSLDEVLQDFPDVELVLHSSWRLVWETDIELKENLPESLASKIRGVTPRTVMSRYASIEAYCTEHAVTQVCIIDDESAAFPAGLTGLVVCDQAQGISSPETRAKLRAALTALSPAALWNIKVHCRTSRKTQPNSFWALEVMELAVEFLAQRYELGRTGAQFEALLDSARRMQAAVS